MKTLLEILPEEIVASESSLMIEINTEGFAFTVKNEEESRFDAVAIYQFFDYHAPFSHNEKALEGALHKTNLLKEEYKSVKVVFSNPEAVLMPFELYRSEKNQEILQLVCGDMDMGTSALTDIHTDLEIYTIYRVPSVTQQMLQITFPEFRYQHLYSGLLKVLPPKEDRLFAFFSGQKICVKLNLSGQTLLINTYSFSTPTDAAYILLNICKQYEISSIPIEIGGLIEKDSMLFREIYKYFHDIGFSTMPSNCRASEAITHLPAHYFSPIFAVHSCAS